MSYIIPNMPLSCRVIRWDQNPFAGTGPVGSSFTIDCQLRFLKTAFEVNSYLSGPSMLLLLPAFTDIRGANSAGNQDCVEVPDGSGRFYYVWAGDDIAKGFPNENRAALIVQATSDPNGWPIPLP